jgi:acetoin:2,6-dichlorophenolindophenol oxidoreductase subunit alpha
MQPDKKVLVDCYRKMRQIREFEESIHRENTSGEIPGFLHLSSGQEANPVGVCSHLSSEDVISSTHRGHGHCLAKGTDIKGMLMELYGREQGVCGGRGGSMHISDLSVGSLGANGIVGAGGPIATGSALSQKMRKTTHVTVCFHGDGATNEGYMFEAMNLAVIWQLPIIFYCENNQYGEFTGAKYSVGANSILARAKGFGMKTIAIDGTDFFDVYKESKNAIDHCRSGNGPVYIEASTVRFHGHFEGDPQLYRSKEEVEDSIENRDCIKKFRQRVIKEKLLSEEDLNRIDVQVVDQFREALDEVRAAPMPNPESLLNNVYISY